MGKQNKKNEQCFFRAVIDRNKNEPLIGNIQIGNAHKAISDLVKMCIKNKQSIEVFLDPTIQIHHSEFRKKTKKRNG